MGNINGLYFLPHRAKPSWTTSSPPNDNKGMWVYNLNTLKVHNYGVSAFESSGRNNAFPEIKGKGITFLFFESSSP